MFVVGGIDFGNGIYREYWWQSEAEFVRTLLEFNGTIWAHFGGGYDYKWLLDWAAALGYRVRLITAGSRIVSMRIGKANFCDSYALVPMSLEKFTSGLGVEKVKLGLECRCGLNCGGYCRIRRRMPKADKKKLSTYLKRDCNSLRNSLEELKTFAETHDIDLGITVGSSAWRNVRRKHGIWSVDLSESDYRFIRDAYFGGRTEIYRRNPLDENGDPIPFDEAYLRDVNSMYPYCLSEFALPVGERWRSYGKDAQKLFDKGQPGFYRCVVDVPEMFLPPLPLRYNNGTSLAFPWGKFGGTWSLPELQWAMKRGVKVTVIESLTFERTVKIFRPWIIRLWHLRLHCMCPDGIECDLDNPQHNRDSKKSPLGVWIKFLLNSLIGKFGSNPEQERWMVNPKFDDIRLCDCPLDTGPCKKGHHNQVSQYAWVSTEHKILDCAHVEWAAYGLAHARIILNQAQVLGGTSDTDPLAGSDMLYSDTDSLIRFLMLFMNEGDELGQLQSEPDTDGKVYDFIGVAPKVYSYRMKVKGKEKLVSKAKGVALPTEEIDGKKTITERPKIGKKYSKEKVFGFRKGAKAGKFFDKETLTRTLNERSGGRRWMPSILSTIKYPENVTYPPHISELKV